MNDLFLSISTGTVDWSRAQFALTAIYHWLFVPLTLGLALIMGIMETCYYRTGKVFWKDTARFWQKLFGINFAMGVATGIILEFEFGTNWSNYSWLVGDIFGAPLAIEGIVAFFLEATFVGVMFFGWNKVSRGFHLASTWLTGLGATISAWWILVANAWMQNPVGQAFNPDTMRNEMTSFAEVALSPFAVDKFFHTVISAWIIGAIFTVAVSCYLLFRKKRNDNDRQLAVESIKIASITGLVASLFAIHTGDSSAYMVAKSQPMKLAAMEALYDGGQGEGLTLVALVNPFSQPDYAAGEEPQMKIAVPKMLSFLATRDFNGYVPGINDIIKGGYTMPDGSKAVSLEEKMERGRTAIAALAGYREAKANNDADAASANRKKLDESQSVKSYLFAIAQNYALNYIRHRKVIAANDLPLNLYLSQQEENVEEHEKLLAALEEKLKELPLKQREVLEKCVVENKKYKEVAEELGISQNTVKTHLMRALSFLRKNLDEREMLLLFMAYSTKT